MVKAGLSLFFCGVSGERKGRRTWGEEKRGCFAKIGRRSERGGGEDEEGRKSVNAEEEEGSTTFSSPFS